MTDIFDERPAGEEEGEAETSFIEGDDKDSSDPLDDLPDLDGPESRSFRNENAVDSFRKRRAQIVELSVQETADARKAEYVKRLLKSEYRLNPNDGPTSRESFRRLGFNKYWISFDKVGIAYIEKSGKYKMLEDKKSAAATVVEFKKLYEKARREIEHRGKVVSVMEEETGGDILEENREAIAGEDVVNASDDLVNHAERLHRSNHGTGKKGICRSSYPERRT